MSWPTNNWPQNQMNAQMAAQYSPEQWSQMQQQNWQQWAQWQQQYQQWHQQYGAEYQKSMGVAGAPQPPLPALGKMDGPPPLPVESKPPLPPEEPPPSYQEPPPNSRPLQWPQQPQQQQQPPQQQQPLQQQQQPPQQQQQQNKRSYGNDFQSNKRQKQWCPKPDTSQEPAFQQRQYFTQPPPNIPPSKPQTPNIDELSEAEKKFDKEFAAWEAQFNNWKQQNANHPDKNQYREYEKKWESWRNSLLDRREQMRKKRLNSMGKMVPQAQELFNKPPPSFPTSTMPSFQFDSSQPPPLEQGSEQGFLSAATGDGIPGLDLVKDYEPGEENDNKKDIIELDREERAPEPKKSLPDFEAISKGINTILGDQKLLSMLSMVTKNTSLAPPVVEAPVIDHSIQNSNEQDTVNSFDDQTRSSFNNYDQQVDANMPEAYENNSFVDAGPSFKQRNRNVREDYSENYNDYSQDYGDNYDNYNEDYGDNYNEDNYNEDNYNEDDYYEDNGENYNNEYEEDQEYDEKYHEWFNEEPQITEEVAPEVKVEEDDGTIFEPSTVIDYEHKSMKKNGEVEITLDPIHMFDYRHKPLSRIPIPQRPQWLINSVRYIREFEPIAMTYDRSFNSRAVSSRRPHYRDEGILRRPPREERRPTFEKDNKFSRPQQQQQSQPAQNVAKDKMKDMDFDELSDDDMDWAEDKPGNAVKRESPKTVGNPPAPSIGSFSNVTMIEDLICAPGRYSRPRKLVIILRGPPGSGKTFLAKLIKDKEVETCGSAPRILSLDDYFMVEQEKEVVVDGKKTQVKDMVYEYEKEMEDSYRNSLIKSFKKTITDGYFPFIIVDNINDKVKYFGEMWSFAKHNGFQVYICQMDLDPQVCAGRNIHNRTVQEIEDCVAAWEPTPNHHPLLDASSFLQGTVQEVEMEDALEELKQEDEDEVEDHNRSKWDNFDCSSNNLAKLDGLSRPLRGSRTMQEYLQLEDEPWSPPRSTKPGKKRVRWADLEQQKQQAKMRALGFVVGHRNWGDIMDETGESALTQTKYIERVRKF